MKKDYPKRRKDLRDEKPSVGVAEGSSLFDRGGVFLATTEIPEMLDWILYPGCSFYMSLVREHFYTYQPCEKGIVNMTNRTQIRVAGVETVQIRMSDGVVRRVTGARHVPSLQKKSDFFEDFGCDRLPLFISRWSFEGLQRSYDSLKRRNV